MEQSVEGTANRADKRSDLVLTRIPVGNTAKAGEPHREVGEAERRDRRRDRRREQAGGCERMARTNTNTHVEARQGRPHKAPRVVRERRRRRREDTTTIVTVVAEDKEDALGNNAGRPRTDNTSIANKTTSIETSIVTNNIATSTRRG